MFKKRGERTGWTLGSSLVFEGFGIMKGSFSRLEIRARQELGFSFHLPDGSSSFDEKDVIPCRERMTQVGSEGRVKVKLVEHLLSAIYGAGFDSAALHLIGEEIPFFDGSAKLFAEALHKVEKVPSAPVPCYSLVETFSYNEGESDYLLLPFEEGLRWRCLVDYPDCPAIGLQYFDFDRQKSDYLQEVAPARSFCLESEVASMQSQGVMLGATLENGLVFGPEGPLNREGMRYTTEPARHKTLDLLGDLALLALDLRFQGVAIKPSHRANNSLAKILRKSILLPAL